MALHVDVIHYMTFKIFLFLVDMHIFTKAIVFVAVPEMIHINLKWSC